MNSAVWKALIISAILYENWSQTNNNSHKHDDISNILEVRVEQVKPCSMDGI